MMKKTILIIAAALLFCMAAILVPVGIENNRIEIAYDELIAEDIASPVQVVFLADLHGRRFGKGNLDLIEKIRSQGPDVICLVGDMFSRNGSDADVCRTAELIAALAQTAPVYYSLGNHEMDYIDVNGKTALEKITQAGALLLQNEYVDLCINGTSLRLGGMGGLAFSYGDGSGFSSTQEYSFLSKYTDTELFTLLLCHRPEAFYFKDAYENWSIDCILSGHTHGGLVRLPRLGGLYAPMQGIFPDVYYGRYELGETTMFVTSGLAGYGLLPRVNNPPEIRVVTIRNAD